MQVPFVSLKSVNETVQKEVVLKLAALLERGDFILGQEVGIFEKAYSKFCQTEHCVGLSNGLDALKISLKALDIVPGDEVIVPANTYIASIFAIIDTGATPVLVEPDILSYNITAATITVAITPRTKAIMPVHLYGHPCEMDDILSLAAAHSLYVIEDNAQAQGASYKGKVTGGFGHINATSFYPSKNLGAMGDAGAITTDDAALAAKTRLLGNMGSSVKYHHEVMGYNARLDTFQAAVLNCKLPYLIENNNERKSIAARYIANLSGTDTILPQTIEGAEHVYHLFVIRHEQRDKLQDYLTQHGIQTLIHYPIPPHLQPALDSLGYKKGQFPVTEEISETCLSLPIFVGMTEDQIDFVSDKIIAFDRQHR